MKAVKKKYNMGGPISSSYVGNTNPVSNESLKGMGVAEKYDKLIAEAKAAGDMERVKGLVQKRRMLLAKDGGIIEGVKRGVNRAGSKVLSGVSSLLSNTAEKSAAKTKKIEQKKYDDRRNKTYSSNNLVKAAQIKKEDFRQNKIDARKKRERNFNIVSELAAEKSRELRSKGAPRTPRAK